MSGRGARGIVAFGLAAVVAGALAPAAGAAPTPSITGAPPEFTSTPTARIDFTSGGGFTRSFQCRLEGPNAGGSAAWHGCASPAIYNGLSDGRHTFFVRAIDSFSPLVPPSQPASTAFTVDTQAPSTVLVNSPDGKLVESTGITLEFASGEGDVSFRCSIDGGGATPCSSPHAYPDLGRGNHRFSVQAVDRAGNADPTPAEARFELDPLPLTSTIESGPEGFLRSDEASFGFQASRAASAECRLDAAEFSPCTTPARYTGLSQGEHVFTVRAIDTYGNVEATPPSRRFVVDTIDPKTTLTSGPSGDVETSSAEFVFASDPGVAFECQLDGSAFEPCTSPKTYTGLAESSAHTFAVRATDQAGNSENDPVVRRWRILGIPPSVRIVTPAAGATVRQTKRKRVRRKGKVRRRTVRVGLSFTGRAADSSGVRSVDVALLRVRTVPCAFFDGRRSFTPRPCTDPLWLRAKLDGLAWTYKIAKSVRLPKGTYEIRVRAIDNGGLSSETTTQPQGRPAITFKIR